LAEEGPVLHYLSLCLCRTTLAHCSDGAGAGHQQLASVALCPSGQALPNVAVLGCNPEVVQALETAAVHIVAADLPLLDTAAIYLR
jgi:hypothetical protein